MNLSQYTQFALQGLRPQSYPSIDIHPVFIQYMFSFVIILCINFVAVYQFAMEMWKIYAQDNLESIIHDVYDKTILHTSLKYVCLNIICIIYFYDLTSPSVQIVRIFWLYCLTIVFMKFDIKDILWPAVGLFSGLTAIAWLWIAVFDELPAFKIILIQTLIILYFGANQSYQITKILNFHRKDKNMRTEVSLETLLDKDNLQKSKKDYESFSMNVKLDQNVIGHLQNRRSFCLIFCCVLTIDLILLLDLSAGKQLVGQVLLSVILDLLPLCVVFWYLRKTSKQKQDTQKRMSMTSEGSASSFKEKNQRTKSKILIEMVNLKN